MGKEINMAEATQGPTQISARAQWSLESLQGEAYNLLKEFLTAALRPEANELDKVKAETARLIVEIGEKKAPVMDRQAGESKIAEIQNYGEQLIKTLTEEVMTGRSEAKSSEQAVVAQLLEQSLKSFETKRKEFTTSLDRHAWEAWDKACEELLALRAGGDPSGKQGGA
jgi:hypothetical protein